MATRLAAAGVDVVDVLCGEFVTSLDMSGLSLTLFWLDDELEAWWSAPADTPAYKKTSHRVFERRNVEDIGRYGLHADEDATAASQQLARVATVMLGAVAEAMHAHEVELGRLDSVAGDGDHGAGMCRGADGALEIARAKLDRHAGST